MTAPISIFSHQPPLVASADVLPRRVIRATGAYTGAQATAVTQEPRGVSNNYPKFAPDPKISTNPLAQTGDPISYFGEGAKAEVDVGATALVANGEVTTDANGKVIPVLGSPVAGTWVVGFSEQAFAAGTVGVITIRIRKVA